MKRLLFIVFLTGCSEVKTTSCCCCQCPKPIEIKTVYVKKPKYTIDSVFSNIVSWFNETPITPSK